MNREQDIIEQKATFYNRKTTTDITKDNITTVVEETLIDDSDSTPIKSERSSSNNCLAINEPRGFIALIIKIRLIVHIYIQCFISLLLIMIACYAAYIKFSSNCKFVIEPNYVIKNDLSHLNEQMTQPRQVWITLKVGLDSIVDADAKHPASAIAVVHKGAERTMECLTHRLAETFNKTFHDSFYVQIDAKSNRENSSAVLKEDIDDRLKNLSKSHFAVVHNLDDLPPEAAMIFHGYCDNENAPFKQAFFLFTMKNESNYEVIDENSLRKNVYQRLQNKWQPALGIDTVSSLLSRIVFKVIVVKPESESVLRKLCP